MAQDLNSTVYLLLQPAPKEIYCRLCLVTSITIKYKRVFSPFNTFQSVAQIIEDFARIEILPDDEYSKLICLNCFEKLSAAIEFRSVIKESDIKLRNRFFETGGLLENDDLSSIEFGGGLGYCNEFKGDEPDLNCLLNDDSLPLDDGGKDLFDLKSTSEAKEEFAESDVFKIEKAAECEEKVEDAFVETSAIQCDICGKEFKSFSGLGNHKLIHSDQTFTCEHCGKTFKRKTTLNEHRMLHSVESPYECDICHRSFKSSGQRSDHVRNSHTPVRTTPCDLCGKLVRSLSGHMKTHTKPYKCDICQQSFGSKQILRNHQIIHTGDRMYSCKVCGKTFRHSAGLFTHKRVHDDEKRFPCELCDKKFNYKHHYRQHQQKCHPKEENV